MKNLFAFLLIFCLGKSYCFSQEVDAVDSVQLEEMQTDEVTASGNEEELSFKKPTPRIVSPDSLQKIKAQPEFAYMQYIDSFYKAKDPLVNKNPEPEKVDSPGLLDNEGFRTLYWALAVFVAVWILVRLFAGNSSIFARNKKINDNEATTHDIALTQDHLAELLNNAIAAKDYRLAVRYLYLQTLSVLGDKNLLSLAPQKTNYQYQQELHNDQLKPAFSKLTMQYEYSWFGNIHLSAQQFEEIYAENKRFRERL